MKEGILFPEFFIMLCLAEIIGIVNPPYPVLECLFKTSDLIT